MFSRSVFSFFTDLLNTELPIITAVSSPIIAAHHAPTTLEDRVDALEELMRSVIRATAMLAEAADRPRTAASLRELL